jgi:hypothetical protein
LLKPQVGFPEKEGDELEVAGERERRAVFQVAERGGVGGKGLLLRDEGILPPAHGGRDVLVALTDLGKEALNLLVGAHDQVGTEVPP